MFLFSVFLSGCTGLFYFPSRQIVRMPSEIGIDYEQIRIVDQGFPTLAGWFLPARGAVKGTVLFLHGNAENISTHFGNIYWLPEVGYQVFIFDYAGYGESEGTVSIGGAHSDVLRMIHAVASDSRTDKEHMFLIGQSLGGSMALFTAARPEVKGIFKGVVADSAFSSYRGIAREKLAAFWITYLLQWPLGFLINDDYSPDKVVQNMDASVLLICGASDRTVSPHNSRDLCAMMGKNCSLMEIDDVDHGGTMIRMDVRKRIADFMNNISYGSSAI